jgi:pimeloyl-ACP methyl ester carboxylesterase
MSGRARAIAVHGWIADHRLFDPLLPHLDPGRVEFVAMDCRGYGTRRNGDGPYCIDTIAADVLGLAGELGWETFHIVGHSMGGMAAQHLMVQAPERLQSAVLIAPVPACGIPAGDLTARAITDRDARRQLIDVNSGGVQGQAWLERLLGLSFETTLPEALHGYRNAWTTTDFAARMGNTATPVLSVLGDLDPGITAKLIRSTIGVWRPDGLLVQMRGCGHYPMAEEPRELADLLHSWLNSPVRTHGD